MKTNCILFLVMLLMTTGKLWAQNVVIDNTATGNGGSIPTGWSGVNNISSQPINQTAGGGYYLVESSASNRDFLISRTYSNMNGALSANITFSIATYGTGSSNGAPIRVEMSLDGGTTWSSAQTSGANPTSTTYTAGNVTFAGPINSTQVKFRFSDANLGSPFVRIKNIVISAEIDATPVTLKSFTATTRETETNLSWTTVKEQNNKGFEIERSADSKTWSTIGFVASQAKEGNSSQELNYSFYDKQTLSGANLYRLKQIDFDGAFEHSTVRKVNFDGDAKMYTIYPNPAQNTIKIDGLEGTETIKVYNALGRLVKTANAAKATIEVADLAAGIYNVQILDANQAANHKLVIAK